MSVIVIVFNSYENEEEEEEEKQGEDWMNDKGVNTGLY